MRDSEPTTATKSPDDSDKEAERQNGGHLPQDSKTHNEHHIGGADSAFGGLTQGADQHHGHNHGDKYHQRGTEAAAQLLAYG